MWLSLDSGTYRRFHNLIIPSSHGTTQIDHLLVSPYGLFIVETKNKSGWIFGSENQSQWTQVLFNSRYAFQNPLHQTYRQKKTLAEFLGVNESHIHTVVFFVGDCTFKTRLPGNVITSGIGSYIRNFRDHVFSPQETNIIVKNLEEHNSTSALRKNDHLQSLRERHSSTSVCPKCGSALVERTARNGRGAGSRFLGCSGYPKCRFTRNI